MFRTLASPRLDFRPCTEADAVTLLDHWAEPAVRRFLFDNRIVSVEAVEQLIQTSSSAFRKHSYGLWKLSSKIDGEFCGVCGFGESEVTELDLVFSIAPPAWGRGLATEGARRVLQYVFGELGLPRVSASVDQPNRPSIKVLEKLGLSLQGVRIVNSNVVLLYAITLEEYFARPTGGSLCAVRAAAAEGAG